MESHTMWCHGVRLFFAFWLSLASVAAGQDATISVASTEEVLAEAELADGSVVQAGRYGGEPDTCALGSRAFLRHVAADGTVLWHRYHQALASPLCNRRAGFLLLDDLASLDADAATASSLHALHVDEATGDLYAVGEVRLTWLEGQVTRSARGAFLGHWDGQGNLLRDAYLGPQPTGPPSLPSGCLMVCSLIDDPDQDPLTEFGGRGLDVVGSDMAGPDGVGTEVVITGWTRQASWMDRDAFVARFSGDDLGLQWLVEVSTEGEDEGRDVAVNAQGESFVAGFSGLKRQAALAKISADGTLDAVATFDGAQDDEAHTIEIDAQGQLSVQGLFADDLIIGNQVLQAGSEKIEGWSGHFTPSLVPIDAEVIDVSEVPDAKPIGHKSALLPVSVVPGTPSDLRYTGQKSSHSQAPDGVTQHTLTPIAFQVVTGTPERGGLRELGNSDDRYLRVVSQGGRIDLAVWLDPEVESGMPVYLQEVRAEVRSEFCYTATVSVNGMDGEEFLVAGQRSLCPSDEPILTVPIRNDLARALGLDGQVPVQPGQRIHVLLTLEFFSSAPPPVLPGGISPQTSAQDSSVDQISADVDY